MMAESYKLTWGDFWKFIIALAAFGTVALSGEGQLAILGAVAILLVWILNFFFEKWKVQLHKNWLTGILAVIAIVMVYIYQPELFPILPIFTPETWFRELTTFIGALIVSAAPIISSATLAYNILLEQILAKLQYQIEVRLLKRS